MTRREGSGFEILLQTGGITFSFLFANWKCSGRVNIQIQILTSEEN